MPEQQPQQSQQQSSSHQSESSSSTGMIRQHNYNNNNNDNGANKRGGSSPAAKPNASESSLSPEQKMPLNLVSTPPGTLTTTTTTIMGQQQMNSGMALSCDLFQRPFQSAYMLHMHRTYFHNQPPPADESMNENDINDTSTTIQKITDRRMMKLELSLTTHHDHRRSLWNQSQKSGMRM